MIDHYPKFTKLDLSLAPQIKSYCDKFEPYSDFNFTSIFCWNTDDSAKVSWLNDNLVIQLPDYTTGKTVVSLLGTQKIDASLQTLLSAFNSVELVPEIVIDHLQDKDSFIITEDRDNHDYIYSLKELTDLPGGKFKKKRGKINSVKNQFGDKLQIRSVEQIDKKTASELMEVFTEWTRNADQQTKESRMETQAFEKLLGHTAELNLITTILSLENKNIGFSVNEILNNDFAICHFEKSLPVHEQVASLLTQVSSKDLTAKGCRYVNWEQDLGILGLRKSKSSYQPIRFLKKYSVTAA